MSQHNEYDGNGGALPLVQPDQGAPPRPTPSVAPRTFEGRSIRRAPAPSMEARIAALEARADRQEVWIRGFQCGVLATIGELESVMGEPEPPEEVTT